MRKSVENGRKSKLFNISTATVSNTQLEALRHEDFKIPHQDARSDPGLPFHPMPDDFRSGDKR
jgi:hypothetical protein